MRPLEIIPLRRLEYEPPSNCHDFGLSALLTPILADVVGASAAEIAAPVLSSTLTGIAGSEVMAGITGGSPLKALEGGAISGVVGGALGEALGPVGAGLSETAAKGIGGAIGGGVSSAVTGDNILKGAATGGALGAVGGAVSDAGGIGSILGTTSGPTGTGGTAAVGSAPAAGAPGAASTAGTVSPGASSAGGSTVPIDLTSSLSTDFASQPAAATMGISGGVTPSAAPMYGPASFGGWGGGSDAGATPAAAGAGATSGGGLGGVGNKLLGFVENNPGVLLAGGLLGANMLMGNKPLPAEQSIQRMGEEAASQARTLEAYQQSGTLPAGLQSIVDQQTKAAEAALSTKFADLGLSGSTMERQQLAQIKMAKAAEIAQFADALAKQGIQWAGLSVQEFNQLLAAQQANEDSFTKALGSFAGGLAGMRSPAVSNAAA